MNFYTDTSIIEAPPSQNQSHLDSKARGQKIKTQKSRINRGKGSKNYEHDASSSYLSATELSSKRMLTCLRSLALALSSC